MDTSYSIGINRWDRIIKARCFSFISIMLLALVFSGTVCAQQEITVTGEVTDENNEPLPGATIVVEGTEQGTTTDMDGRYMIDVAEDAVLIFSFVGYQTQEVQVEGRSEINVRLLPQAIIGDELVVVGYGTQQRREITSAISSISAEQLVENQAPSSVDDLLQGKVSGVQVVKQTGAPGGGVEVRIRGNTSIGAGNEPLYVVDGVPIRSGDISGLTDGEAASGVNALAGLNPGDIESIEILKDAAATSIYGARAANGVVLITTKQGIPGEPSVSFNVSGGVQEVSRYLPVVNSRQWRELLMEAWHNRPREDAFEHMTDSLNPSYNNDVFWQDKLFRTAPVKNVDLSVSGGSQDLTYAVNLGYLDQKGIIQESGFERYSARFNGNYTPNQEKWALGSNISFSRSSNNRIADGHRFAGGSIRSPMNTIFEFVPPTQAPRDTSGALIGGFNPLAHVLATNDAFTNRLLGNIHGEYNILDALRFRASIGLDLLSLKEEQFFPGFIRQGASDNRKASVRNFQDLTWINEYTLNYENNFAERHDFSALLGFSQQESQTEIVQSATRDAPTDKITTLNAGATLVEAFSRNTSWGLMSLFTRLDYSYDNKYILQGTIRRDGSSRFGSENRWGIFPSLSVGWRLSEEPFLREVGFIEDLKIRFSVGKTGNQEIDNFVSQGLYQAGENYNGQAGVAATINGLPNRELSWESTTQYDLGLDASLFNGRVSLITDFYYKETEDLLFNIPVPTTSGFSSLTTNFGSVENKGLEIALKSFNVSSVDFTWTTDFNISFNRNKILELPGGKDIFVNATDMVGLLREGEPMGTFYGYKYLGVYSRSEDVPDGLRMQGRDVEAGDAIFENLNGDDLIDTRDRSIIGDAQPDFTGGLSNTISYKGIEFHVSTVFSYGNEILNAIRANRDNVARAFATPSPKIFHERWQQEGDITDVPKAVSTDPKENGRTNSTRWLEDGSYFRFRTIRLGYNLPNNILENLGGLQRAKFYISGQNLITFTDYSGYDPEGVTTSNQSTGVFGVDIGRFPISKSITVGLDVKL